MLLAAITLTVTKATIIGILVVLGGIVEVIWGIRMQRQISRMKNSTRAPVGRGGNHPIIESQVVPLGSDFSDNDIYALCAKVQDIYSSIGLSGDRHRIGQMNPNELNVLWQFENWHRVNYKDAGLPYYYKNKFLTLFREFEAATGTTLSTMNLQWSRENE